MMETIPATASINPWTPLQAQIRAIRQEVPGVATYDLALETPSGQDEYRFLPGQFNMLYLPGFGESAISVSSDPAEHGTIAHTVRIAGNVTQALSRKEPNDQIGIRGPFGTSWPMEQCRGRDVVLACGGIGLAPLRPAIYHLINNRDDYGRVTLLYGARTSGDLLYSHEYDQWRAAGIEVEVTVDLGESDWQGHIGVVPALFYHMRLDGQKTFVMTCGPEIMIRFVIFEALARKVPPDQLFISLERNMSCAMGFCGHCQLGPAFICKDGPVFNYVQMEPYLNLEDL